MEKKKIKILVDAHVFDGGFQGTRTFIKGIYQALLHRPDVIIFLAAFDIKNLRKEFGEKENLVFIPFKSRSAWYRLAIDIPSLVRKHQIDYAHFQYFTPLIKNCKLIITTHDVIFNEYPEEFSRAFRVRKNLLFRLSAHRADILTTVSSYSAQSIRKYLGIQNKKIYITPNGVDGKFFEPFDKGQAAQFIFEKYGVSNFILYVSRIEPRKNHRLLLQAYLDQQWYSKGFYLVLLGYETIPVKEFDEIIGQLSPEIRKFIFIKEDVDNHDLLEFYRAATLFVYPSKAEGFGIPPLEAAALKTPVLCSNTSAMSDFTFFEDKLFDPYDEDGFRKKLQHTLESKPDENFLERVSQAIRQKYTWEHSADVLYQGISE